MTMSTSSIRPLCRPWLLVLALAASAVQAGGDMADDDHDDGPSVFGFVKDGRGVAIAGAKVTMILKSGTEMATRSVANGMYKFERLNMQFDPQLVTIACAKEGYKQARVLKRSGASADPKKPTEIECRMDKG
jgi:hypothetical protein